ncbi:14348_t:CDS:2, partial [Gigaspora rosea]
DERQVDLEGFKLKEVINILNKKNIFNEFVKFECDSKFFPRKEG